MKRDTFRAAVGVFAVGSGVGLIIIAARLFSDLPGQPLTATRPPVPLLPGPVLVGALALVAAAFAYSIGRLLVAVFREPAAVGTPPRVGSRETLAAILAVVAGLVVLYFATAFAMSLMELPEEQPADLLEEGQTGSDEEELEEAPPLDESMSEQPQSPAEQEQTVRRSRLTALIVTALAAVTALGLGVRTYLRYAARPEADERDDVERLSADLHATSERSLERMLGEPDDRRAVIAAYALVEESFARHGYPRQASQTPAEFMDATLRALEARSAHGGPSGFHYDARTALLTLTRLYELAKFSDHPVRQPERRRAVACLEEIGAAVEPLGGRSARGGGSGV